MIDNIPIKTGNVGKVVRFMRKSRVRTADGPCFPDKLEKWKLSEGWRRYTFRYGDYATVTINTDILGREGVIHANQEGHYQTIADLRELAIA